jgi:CDP-diacylglycerol--glycerol-3-phosphate 3-phosphatidyltransferase
MHTGDRMESGRERFDQMTFHTTPNYLTLLRVFMVPAVILALAERTPSRDVAAAVFFGIASITDYFDGYLARKYKIETVYGKLLDPLADKFLVICSLIMLEHLNRMSPYVVMILVCRELTITGLRALASAEGVIVGASQGGKWKTALQMIAIPCLMVQTRFGIPFFEIGMWLTYLSLAFSIWSAKDYIVGFFRGLRIATALRKERRMQKRLAKQRKREQKLRASLKTGSREG